MTKDEILKAYEIIYSHFVSGSLDFVLFISLRTLYESKKIESNEILSTTLLNSSFNSSVLSLSNLIKNNSSSINLRQLMKLIVNSKDLLGDADQESFQVFTDQFEDAISKQAATIEHLLILRDKTIAHIDKKQITDPSFFLQKLTSTIGDIESTFVLVEGAIIEVGRYLGFNSINLHDTISLLHFSLRKRVVEMFEPNI